MRRLVLVPAACLCLKSMTMRSDEWPLGKALVCMINKVNVILSRFYGCMTLVDTKCDALCLTHSKPESVASIGFPGAS